MSIIDLGHAQLNTRIDGEEGAPWIVLSNSLGSSLHMWDDQMLLLTRKYRVLRYDKRGHGGSSTPKGPYSFAELGDDAVGLMDHFGIEQADWMGLSMGAMTGMGLALTHPNRFARMVLADGRADMPDPNQSMWDQRIAAIRDGGLEAIVDGTLAMWLTQAWRDANPDRVANIRRMVTGNDPEGYIACCEALKKLDYLRYLGEINLPVLYVVGSDDMGAPPTVMREMADVTPRAEFVEIPDAGHVANINSPAKYNAAIAQFLGIVQ